MIPKSITLNAFGRSNLFVKFLTTANFFSVYFVGGSEWMGLTSFLSHLFMRQWLSDLL